MGRKSKRASGLDTKSTPAHPPDTMYALIPVFAEWQRVRGYTDATVASLVSCNRGFIDWCHERGIDKPSDVSKQVIERYQRWLYHYRTDNDRPLKLGTQVTRLKSIRSFFRWLNRGNHIPYNPTSDMEIPKAPQLLPRYVLTVQEAETILSLANPEEPLGLRDRALLETLYSTGVRRKELASLDLRDLDTERGTLQVREGKGRVDRIVPIGQRAVAWVEKYLAESRPLLATASDGHRLFLSNRGTPFALGTLGNLVKDYFERAGFPDIGSCHVFRHSMATVMLENGADIRFIQAILGHKNLGTTQIYTHVAIRKLKEIHTATHPTSLQRRATPVEPKPAEDRAQQHEALLADDAQDDLDGS